MILPKRILAATSNRNKLKELNSVAVDFGVEIISPQTIAEEKGLSLISDPVEDAESYYGNALIKAKAYYQWAKFPVIADDSGLEVAALNNRPGVYSARYGGNGLSDQDRYKNLLDEVKGVWAKEGGINRSAAFVCNLVFVFNDTQLFSAEAKLEGEILDEPRGTGGFGYDPVIYIYSLGATLAEVDFSVTCQKGFRGQALRKLFSQFQQ